MSEKLKQCPFCGGEAELITIGSRAYLIKCKTCQIKTPRVTKAETAVRIWNTRKPMKRIVEQIADKIDPNVDFETGEHCNNLVVDMQNSILEWCIDIVRKGGDTNG